MVEGWLNVHELSHPDYSWSSLDLGSSFKCLGHVLVRCSKSPLLLLLKVVKCWSTNSIRVPDCTVKFGSVNVILIEC